MPVEEGGYPTKIKDAFRIHIYKRKRNPQVTSTEASIIINWWKDTVNILLNRLNVHLDQTGIIPESQRGFRKDRRTIDIIFTARQLHEKCQEQRVKCGPLHDLKHLTQSVVMGFGK